MNPRHLVDTTVFYSPTSGGVRRYLAAKHTWLAAQPGWQHTLLVPGAAQRIERGGVSTLTGVPVPGTFNYRLPLNPRLWARQLDALAPDLIEAGDAFHPAWATWQVARRRGIPCAAFCHSNLPRIAGRRFGSLSERLLSRYLRELYGKFDVVFAPSRLMLDFLASLGIRHVVRQPLGVDARVFHPCRRGPWLRGRLGLGSAARVLVYAGRFSSEKNLPVLLRTFAALGRPYHLLLIGGGRAARLAPNVTRVPYRRDSIELACWLASADALVHAGTLETFGLIVLEAMACGRPVVAARAGAIPELVDERCGLLSEPGDSASLADAVAALYERDMEALGAHARAQVLRLFTWSRVLEGQLSVYRALLAGESTTVLEQHLAQAG
jgi:alpha-1,6-mannosyltransferase